MFNLKPSEINESLSRDDLPEWDSLNHLVLLIEVEKFFGIKFSASDIAKIKKIADIGIILKAKGI